MFPGEPPADVHWGRFWPVWRDGELAFDADYLGLARQPGGAWRVVRGPSGPAEPGTAGGVARPPGAPDAGDAAAAAREVDRRAWPETGEGVDRRAFGHARREQQDGFRPGPTRPA